MAAQQRRTAQQPGVVLQTGRTTTLDLAFAPQGLLTGRVTDSQSGAPIADVLVTVNASAGSASAAEVVTGALKDTGRAVVVGERSFGKGSVQSIFKLKNGEGLRLTTARYFTPGGVSIHEKGITPQVAVVMTPEEDSRVRLQHLRPDVADPKDFKERFGFEPIEDRQLQAARDVLRGVNLLAERAAPEVH